MPVSFDFSNDSLSIRGSSTSLTASSYGSFNATNLADGVQFTMSYYGNFAAYVTFFNATSPFPFPGVGFGTTSGGTLSSSAIFTLSFAASGTPSQNLLSGTVGNPIQLSLSSIGGPSWNIRFLNQSSSTVLSTALSTSFLSLTGTHQISRIIFTTSTGGGIGLSSLSGNALNCFCAGTLMSTPEGNRAVETLKAGDKMLTADGKETTVRWLGTQFVDTKLRHPKLVNPICIKAGALGGGLPERALYLSQDHAVAIDGTLYNAGALVNGETIYQVAEMPNEGFTYYHVETDVHELLVAEGVAAESYIDYAGRDGFDNSEHAERREIAEMEMPRVSSGRMVPDFLKPQAVA